jgi:hypothetical protein
LGEIIDAWVRGVDRLADIPSHAASGSPSRHAAFQGLVVSAVHQLMYLARTSPLAELPSLDRIPDVLWSAFARIARVPRDLDPDTRLRRWCALPVGAGGMGLKPLEEYAALAHLSGWMDSLDTLRNMLYPDMDEADFVAWIDAERPAQAGELRAAVQAAGRAGADACEESGDIAPLLRARDAFLARQLALLPPGQQSSYQRRDGSFRWQRFLSRGVVAGLVAAYDAACSPAEVVARKRAAEPGAGKLSWLLARAARAHDLMPNAEFVVAVHVRAHCDMHEALLARRAAGCALRRKRRGAHGETPGSRCNAPLDALAIHPMLCAIGGGRIRRHDYGLREPLAGALDGVPGLDVVTEHHVEEWDVAGADEHGRPKVVEAWLDVRAEFLAGPHAGKVWYFDPTVYCPWAPSYAGTAHVGPGPHERAKHLTYPTLTPAGQVRVQGKLVPLAFSAVGGLGPEGAKEMRIFFAKCGRSSAVVVPRLAHNVVLHTSRSILRAFGTRAAAAELA